MMAGRRRKSKKTRRGSRKMRGGNGVGINQGPPLAVGVASHEANMTSVPGGAPTTMGGRRRRSRRGKKTRKMRGGMSIAGSGASFTGEGAARGMGGFQGYSTGGPMNVVPLPGL
jgi:hypothetical protein